MPHEHDPPPSRGIVLDIGGDIGALVLFAPHALLGAEVEVSPSTPGAARVHAIVREQTTPKGTVVAAVFPELTEGGYTLWGRGGSTAPAGTVVIEGGRVTEATLRG
jgi:hypothetical protein